MYERHDLTGHRPSGLMHYRDDGISQNWADLTRRTGRERGREVDQEIGQIGTMTLKRREQRW